MIPLRSRLSLAAVLAVGLMSVFGQTPRRQAPKNPTPAATPTPPWERVHAKVTLANGEILTGDFVEANAKMLVIFVNNVRHQLNVEDVALIDFGKLTQPTANATPAPTPDNSGARAAIKALRRLDSVVSAGVTYREYGTRVADTKIAVDEALSEVPDGQIKSSIKDIMDIYAKALSFWSTDIQLGMPSDQSFWWTLAHAQIDKVSASLTK